MKDFYIANQKSASQAFEITTNQLRNVRVNSSLNPAEKYELETKIENRLKMISLVIQQHQK